MDIREISSEELRKMLKRHQSWLHKSIDIDNPQDFSGLDLRGMYLSGEDLRYVNLRGANLSGAWLKDVDFRFADLSGAILVDARFLGADLRATNLQNAICDAGIQEASSLYGSKWLRSDVPWWLGHKGQGSIILCDR